MPPLSSHLGPRAKKAVLSKTPGEVEVFIELSGYGGVEAVERELRRVGALSVRRLQGSTLTATLPVAALEESAKLEGISYVEVGSAMR